MNQADPQQQTTQQDDEESSPLGTLVTGLVVLAVAGFLYYQFTSIEESGGSMRIWWPVALMYNIGGKWPPVGLCAAIGLGAVGVGIKQLLTAKKATG